MLSIRDWHSRLERHFQDLCRARKGGGGHPLYALEHGLSQPEREQLFAAIRSAIQVRRPSDVFWLPWVVYAAELGYEFAGEEYWQTYEERTPGWDRNDYRDWLREVFQRFSRKFGGAEPQGDWARRFSIICWPITHAILPRDLQQQLAHALHDLRWSLRIEHLNDPLALGEAIHSRSRGTNSRFSTFAEDAALVGQIAVALLLKNSSQTAHLVHPETLDRIAADLDRERVARDWLAEARQRAAQVRLRGVVLSSGRPGTPSHPAGPVGGVAKYATGDIHPGARPYQRSTLGIDPRLVLRPSEGGGWTVHLEIPDLQHLLGSAEWSDLLTRSRCRVAGAGKRPLAPGRLLHGAQLIALERWPRADEVLLSFDRASPAIEAALRTTALIPPGPIWLFKPAADGRAYHIRSGVFRPDANYLLLSTQLFEYDQILGRAEVRCAGVNAASVSVPAYVPANLEGLLREYGVARASSIRISPAGVPPLFWDGEGHVEWLATDTPTISVERQAAGEEVDLVLDALPGQRVRVPGDCGNVAYIELPPLPTGAHTVSVETRSADGRTSTAGLEITIRAPRPWTGTLGDQHAVQVVVTPTKPTMEDLLSGRVRIEARGPVGMRVESDVRLWDYRRQNELYRKALPNLRMPFDMAMWRRSFVRNFLDDQPVQDALDQGWAIQVDLAFGSVASQRLLFIRHLSPLRWSVRTHRRRRDVRLFDDTGIDGAAIVHFRSFEEPAVPIPLTMSEPGATLPVPDGGGLLEAVHGDERALAVLAPIQVKDLGALRVNPRLPHFSRAPGGMAALTALAALWADATPQGTRMARLRQCNVLRATHECLVRALCGSRWLVAEHAFLGGRETAHALAREVTLHPSHAEIRHALEAASSALAGLTYEERAERLHAILSTARDSRDLDVGDATKALQLMSSPERVGRLADACWTRLLDQGVLMRAARFLVITSHHHSSGERDITAIPLYVGWS
jgi:hypothetical protein